MELQQFGPDGIGMGMGMGMDERINLLDSAWSATQLQSDSADEQQLDNILHKLGLSKASLPSAPHLENCGLRAQLNRHLDRRAGNETFPTWTIWKGTLGMHPAAERIRATSQAAYPPWLTGSDEENYPFTRRVQADLWLHQHPPNCKDPGVKFLVADWETLPGFGIGAQIVGMSGLLAIAIRENRVLVSNYYNRADHHGCKSSSRSSWSCYFLPETSEECREHAFKLMESEEAWREGIVTTKDNYTSKHIWAGPTPRVWGDPWSYLQPTTEINGTLLTSHRKMDRRWWRAQAVRYLMRFPTEYTCSLMNAARHAAFGKLAAKLVLQSLSGEGPQGMSDQRQRRSDMDQYVWANHGAWIPRPLLSIHVRMGDKACEMKVVEFQEYMLLAHRIRTRYPHVNTIWLSTEMQEVIEKSKAYPNWNFYYTNVHRQAGNTSMSNYEASLGRETSTNYPLVNFLMATEADFFIGALGSTWCSLIDGMRNTGGKVMAGYLSVNKDRFW